MEGLVLFIVRGLVDAPEKVELRALDAGEARLLELKVAPNDVGKVIGRDGRTVNAVRTLLSAAAQKLGVKARLELLDDRRNAPAPPTGEPSVQP